MPSIILSKNILGVITTFIGEEKMATPYPEEFPLSEVKDVVNDVKDGKVKENLQNFAHNVWVVQGYAQASLIGNETPDFVLSTQSVPEDFDAISELEKLCANVEENTVSAQMAIPWEFILQWALKELMDILEEKLR